MGFSRAVLRHVISHFLRHCPLLKELARELRPIFWNVIKNFANNTTEFSSQIFCLKSTFHPFDNITSSLLLAAGVKTLIILILDIRYVVFDRMLSYC